ncbi:MAG: hypothetical protein JXR95_04135 [Deltaproteobacteria bacterium]|nr:hypothetical protein [Deltaproteobacteria bacterium]
MKYYNWIALFMMIMVFGCAGGASQTHQDEICDNGKDDDANGLIDCDDSACTHSTYCSSPEICDNGTDDDGDFLIDCADPGCIGRLNGDGVYCETVEVTCNDGGDNDGDGLDDCDDPDCFNSLLCQNVENCSNNMDDDGDNLVDCDDPDCETNIACQTASENCSNNIDDDGDYLIDCDDPDCTGNASCPGTENCTNNIDDDGDSLVDCFDPDCATHTSCATDPEDCTNGVDDDGDSLVDCFDPDCATHASCTTNPEDCTNGVDDDGDSLVDCYDSDCATHASCTGTSCTTFSEGFESSFVPTGWSLDSYNSLYTWEQLSGSGDGVHGGSYIAYVAYDDWWDDQSEILMSAEITCGAGTVSFWWSGSSTWAYNYDVSVYILTDTDQYLISSGLLADQGSFTDWTWIQKSFTIPAQFQNVPFVIAWWYVGFDGADFYLDDVSLTSN